MQKMKYFVRKKVQKEEKNSMKKIIIVCVIIIITVVSSDIILKNIIFKNFDSLIYRIEKIEIDKGNEYNFGIISNIEDLIRDKSLLMAFYIDHEEIEKIKTQIIIIKAGIEKKDEQFVHEEMQRKIFIINQLKEKNDFKLENIL